MPAFHFLSGFLFHLLGKYGKVGIDHFYRSGSEQTVLFADTPEWRMP